MLADRQAVAMTPHEHILLNIKSQGTTEIAQRVRALVTKSKDPGSDPGTHLVERKTDSPKLHAGCGTPMPSPRPHPQQKVNKHVCKYLNKRSKLGGKLRLTATPLQFCSGVHLHVSVLFWSHVAHNELTTAYLHAVSNQPVIPAEPKTVRLLFSTKQ